MNTRNSAIQGGVLIAFATLIAGLGGYAITIIAARYLQSEYVYFAAFWAFLYLAVGTFSGFQQEITRGTTQQTEEFKRALTSKPSRSQTWLLATAVALVAGVSTAVAASVFGEAAFGSFSDQLFLPLVIGIAANVFVGALSGVLYGISRWWPLTVVIIGDVVLRLFLLFVGFSQGLPLSSLAWLVIAPYGLILLLCWAIFSRTLVTHSRLDVGYRTASLNILRTILASLGTATLVSGMPLFIASLDGAMQENHLSAVIFSLILTRAPLVVGVLALQSFLVVYFRDHSHSGLTTFWRLSAVIIFAAAIISIVAWMVGADLITLLVGEAFRLDPLFIGLLTLTSLPTALLAVAGANALSNNLHTAYSLGWVVAALVAIGILALPIQLDARVLLALGLGPLLGLATLAAIAGISLRKPH